MTAAVAALVAFFAWLISHFVNSPDDAVAGEVDVDVEDADFDTPSTASNPGDTVLLFGRWVMDVEHDAYFEIHPVKSYYLLCEGTEGDAQWEATDETAPGDCIFNASEITSEDLTRMCKLVRTAEEQEPDDKLTVNISQAMAVMP